MVTTVRAEVHMPRATRRRLSSPSRLDPLPPSPLPPPATLYTGRLMGGTADGQVQVRLDGSDDIRVAACPDQCDATLIAQAGRDGVPVVISANGTQLRVVGLLQPLTTPALREVVADEQLVLRSGTASLTLTAAGKVLLRGGYVSSWSNGINRIVGRTVRLD
jgi:hypothetical protein